MLQNLNILIDKCQNQFDELNYSSDEIGIGFNARYLLDVTSQIGTGTIKIALKDAGSPALISVPEDPESLFVLMPMRV